MEKKSVLENKDYSYLEGREFKIVDSQSGDLICVGIVKGCDYYVGITVVNKSEENLNCICINGPNSPFQTQNNYKGAFACLIRKIERGVYFAGTVDKVINKNKGLDYFNPFGKLQCSFSA